MSSHHIVRDIQEPALILVNLDLFPFDLLGQLLEWAPIIVSGDSALDQTIKYGINIDMVYSNRDDLSDRLAHFPEVEMLEASDHWIEEAIKHLKSKGHGAVNLVVGDGYSDLELIHRMSDQMLVDVISPRIKFVRIEQEIQKWMPAGSRMTLLGNDSFQVSGGIFSNNEIIMEKEGMVHIKGQYPFILGQLF